MADAYDDHEIKNNDACLGTLDFQSELYPFRAIRDDITSVRYHQTNGAAQVDRVQQHGADKVSKTIANNRFVSLPRA